MGDRFFAQPDLLRSYCFAPLMLSILFTPPSSSNAECSTNPDFSAAPLFSTEKIEYAPSPPEFAQLVGRSLFLLRLQSVFLCSTGLTHISLGVLDAFVVVQLSAGGAGAGALLSHSL